MKQVWLKFSIIAKWTLRLPSTFIKGGGGEAFSTTCHSPSQPPVSLLRPSPEPLPLQLPLPLFAPLPPPLVCTLSRRLCNCRHQRPSIAITAGRALSHSSHYQSCVPWSRALTHCSVPHSSAVSLRSAVQCPDPV